MSRTDVHRPAWVKENDPHDRRHFVEDHNHWIRECWDPELRRWLVRRPAPCDLDEFVPGNAGRCTRCSLRYIGGRNIYCGCKMCTGHDWRRRERRRDRHQARLDLGSQNGVRILDSTRAIRD